jgi:hypothetical protein
MRGGESEIYKKKMSCGGLNVKRLKINPDLGKQFGIFGV